MTDEEQPEYSVPPTLLGTTYPTEYLTAMFPDGVTAQTAASALETAGFATTDIVLVTGEQLLRNQRQVREQRGVGERLLARFPSYEAQIVEEYVELAQRGYAVVAVRVPESDEALRGRAAETLRVNGGGYLHYYGKYTVTDH